MFKITKARIITVSAILAHRSGRMWRQYRGHQHHPGRAEDLHERARAQARAKGDRRWSRLHIQGDRYRWRRLHRRCQVIDPAQGTDEFNQPDNGKRFVSAVLTITGVSGTAQDDANNDATLNGSDHQVYQPDFDSIAGYTNFNSGDFSVSPGTSQIGAVTFQVPDGVTVTSVVWANSSGFGGGTATWTIHS